MGLASDLYNGRTKYDIVGRTKLWFAVSIIVILVGLASLGTRGLNLGLEFEGGAKWELAAGDLDVEGATDFMTSLGVPDVRIQTLTAENGATRLRIRAEPLGVDEEQRIQATLADRVGIPVEEVSLSSVGPEWGRQITDKALRALAVFLVAITIYVTFRFELKMAIATLAALVHDVLITIGVYSVTGLEVTPPTVIAILTILGFSIYDGIVVFDKVDENTRLVSSTNRITYSDMINLSLNQTLMRSLNTSITALLPILSLLVIGSLVLGATTLQEFAIALLIGLASGAYSSIFIASPLLAVLKEREPRFRDVRRRIEARDASATSLSAAEGDADDSEVEVQVGAAAPARLASTIGSPSGVIPPRPRKRSKRRA